MPTPTPEQLAALQGQPNPMQQTGQPVGPYFNPINGQPSSSPGSPGVSGAIMDAIRALAQHFAPQSIVNRRQNIDSEVGRQSGGNLGDQIGQ